MLNKIIQTALHNRLAVLIVGVLVVLSGIFVVQNKRSHRRAPCTLAEYYRFLHCLGGI